MKTKPQMTLGATVLLLMLAIVPSVEAFVHPGCLSTQADLNRMKAQVAANFHPTIDGWNVLIANSHAQLTWTANPQAIICRGGQCTTTYGLPENYMTLANDEAAAYQCALRYWGSGDVNYANKAVQIMNAWSSTLTQITGDNWPLASGIYGYEFACAGELLHNYSGWAPADFTRFQGMMRNIFYPLCHQFLVQHSTNGTVATCPDHYWTNWDAANMAAVISIGVLCDDQALFDEGVTYFQSGIGTGRLDKAVYYLHGPGLGQWEESGRDQSHTMLGLGLLASFCEVAWNQGTDLYTYTSNGKSLLDGAEYIAEYNLNNTVPFVTHTNCDSTETNTTISATGRGPTDRPFWDQLYNHYVFRAGVAAPYTQQYAALMRPDGGGGNYGTTSGGYDHLGFSTLSFTEGSSLPSMWVQTDVGMVGTAGSGTYAGTTFTVKGAGSDIGSTADSLHYVYENMTGDGSIVVRLATEQIGGATNDKVGVMIRESTANNAAMVGVLLDSSSSTVRLVSRASTGGSAAWQNGSTGMSAPVWFKLVRAGNVFTGSVSTNGTTWTQIGTTVTVTMASGVKLGLAVCSRDTASLNTSTFDNVTAVP